VRALTVGTRGSALALWQTGHVNQAVSDARRRLGLEVPSIEVKVITTQGDTSQAEKLAGQLEKGFFTQELDAELRAGTIDWAVHSLKDLPTRLPADLVLAAVLPRARCSDLLLLRPEAFEPAGEQRLPLKRGARVGSSSLRREAMLTHFSSAAAVPLRGNVPTRIQKLRAGQYDAILLAAAGVERLGLDLTGLTVFELNPHRWQPAPGQGAVAVQTRRGDAEVAALFAPIDHPPTGAATETERSFLRVLEGGCTTPFGCHVEGDTAHLGLLTAGRWRTLDARLTAERPLPSPAVAAILADLQTSDVQEKNDDRWLYRPL